MSINLQDMELPLGFKFNPKDEDAIFFLKEKVFRVGEGGSAGGRILELDPYESKQLPDILSATEKLGSLFFYTKLKRKKGTPCATTAMDAGKNIDRTIRGKEAGGGTWHGDSKNMNVQDGRKKVIGIARKLSYRPPARGTAPCSSKYIMTEYLLPSNCTDYNIFKDWVLCRLVKIVKKSRGKDHGDKVGSDQCAASPNSSANSPEVESTAIMAYDSCPGFEAPPINSAFLLDYSTSTAVEPAPLQALVGVEHGGYNQVMDYKSYNTEVVNNLPVVSTAVESSAISQSVVDIKYGYDDIDSVLMGTDLEDQTPQQVDWTFMEPFVGAEERSACNKAFPSNSTSGLYSYFMN